MRVSWFGIGGDCVMFQGRRRRNCREWWERKVGEKRREERGEVKRT